MSRDGSVVIEVYGEGKTDVGHGEQPEPPTRGVVPILVHTLCDRPRNMLVKRHGMPFLQARKGSLPQKVKFAKRQARLNRSAGAVFVIDSDGDLKSRLRDLSKGRDMETVPFPFAIGVAHACIETWLLADAPAIQRALELASEPAVPDQPERIPAPRQDKSNNPKLVLARAAGSKKGNLTARQMWAIAAAMDDVQLLRGRCPLGFEPFAEEVNTHIRPLF